MTTTKFEILPNEIIIECFQYLNGFEIFYSFDQLNSRFTSLIHDVPLNINFQDINKSMFDQFCTKILLNPKIKNQIYSFKVSDKDQCFQAKIFLSLYPINELFGLQKFELIIPTQSSALIPFCGNEDDSEFYLNLKLADLLQCKLHTLCIPIIRQSVLDGDKLSSITKLTLSRCSLCDIYFLLKQFPMLIYLHIGTMETLSFDKTNTHSNNQYSIHLKQLIIDDYKDEFTDFEIFVKQIPNLKSLTISDWIHGDMINACQWENLITSFLPYLKIFKFKFTYIFDRYSQDPVIDQFKQFQTEFWQQQHHWYTEYVIQEENAILYTLPYPLNSYNLEQKSATIYRNNLVNNMNTFVNVTHLNIYPWKYSENNNSYYFHNVTSIRLCVPKYGFLFTLNYIEYIREIINQCNIKYLEKLNISMTKDPLDLLKLFKLTPHLSHLIINSKSLQICFSNDDLRKYSNKTIKKLDVRYNYIDLWKYNKIDQFCEIFSNVEHLKCCTDNEDDLIFLIEHLPKLSTLKVAYGGYEDPETKLNRFKEEAEKLNVTFDIETKFIDDFKDYYSITLFIWINKNRV